MREQEWIIASAEKNGERPLYATLTKDGELLPPSVFEWALWKWLMGNLDGQPLENFHMNLSPMFMVVSIHDGLESEHVIKCAAAALTAGGYELGA